MGRVRGMMGETTPKTASSHPLASSCDAGSPTIVMAILNVTPDSFYVGGRVASDREAIDIAIRLLDDGADVIDIGAESTRPGAVAVAPEEQIRRIGATIEGIVNAGGRVSIDTTAPSVARFAVERGATMINSVSLDAAAALASVAVAGKADLILMHSRGPMDAMRGYSAYPETGYADVVREVRTEWLRAANDALQTGLPRERLYFDPGLGFQKNARQSIALLAALRSFGDMGFPIAVGASRKSFIAKLAPISATREASPEDRLGGTIAATLAAVDHGAALVRVHDPLAVRQALAIRAAIAASRVSPAGALQRAAVPGGLGAP